VADLGKARDTNYKTIKGLTKWYVRAAKLLVLQIMVWAIVLWIE
jgi:hypothetical protein